MVLGIECLWPRAGGNKVVIPQRIDGYGNNGIGVFVF